MAGRRDTRIREARAHAAQIALELFLAEGYENVTVEHLCREAGLSPATFYRYFGSKEDVVFCLEAEFHEGIAAAAEQHGPDLAAVSRAFVRFLSDRQTIVRQSDELIVRTPALLPRALLVQRRWQGALAIALAARGQQASPQLEDHLHASIVLAVVSAVLRAWDGTDVATLDNLVEATLLEARRAITEMS